MRQIPLVTGTALDLLDRHMAEAKILLAEARRLYTAPAVVLADRWSRTWLLRAGNPYVGELDRLATALGQPGLHMLNLSYEWGCTTGVAPAADGVGSRLLRTLDWPLDGLGRNLAVLHTTGPAGAYYSVSWPGFAGVLTAMAPGRFSVAINQAKAFHGGVAGTLEWPLNRWRMLRSTALPPAHLLRKVCEEASDYATAVRMLSTTPLCLPAFFTLSGTAATEGCVIERECERAHRHGAPAACANHWHYPGLQGATPRWSCRIDRRSGYGQTSQARHAAMLTRLAQAAEGFDWLEAPVLCPLTRLACVMNAARGHMAVMGIEATGPATEILRIAA